MKTLREIRESVVASPSEEAEYIEESNVMSISNIPFVIVLKRKAIRIYPNGQKVALYHNEKLDKFVTIPFSDIGVSEEVEQIDELSKKTLGSYIKKAHDDATNKANHPRGWPIDSWKEKNIRDKKILNRKKGINIAVNKITKEETDLQEVSKELLKRYSSKASEKADNLEKSRDHSGSRARHYALFKDPKEAQRHVDNYNEKDQKLKKRLKGISLADRKSDPKKYEKYPKQFKAKVHATENFDALSEIQGKTRLTFSDKKTMSITEETAKAILALHNKLTEENQEKLVSMVNGTKEQFQTIAEFATQGQ